MEAIPTDKDIVLGDLPGGEGVTGAGARSGARSAK